MRILYPPRPKHRIVPRKLPKYDADPKWVGQLKFNGQRNPVFVPADGEAQVFGRKGAPHGDYVLPAKIAEEFKSLSLANKDYWFDSELLNRKTKDKNYKHRIILFDVLFIGKHLFHGPTLLQRIEMLADICNNPTELEPAHGIALQVTEHIWMAQTFFTDLVARYNQFLHCDEIEGLVLKRGDSKLDSVGGREHEVSWQIRCRKPSKNYQF